MFPFTYLCWIVHLLIVSLRASKLSSFSFMIGSQFPADHCSIVLLDYLQRVILLFYYAVFHSYSFELETLKSSFYNGRTEVFGLFKLQTSFAKYHPFTAQHRRSRQKTVSTRARPLEHLFNYHKPARLQPSAINGMSVHFTAKGHTINPT